MLPPFVHQYILTTLAGTPDVLEGLLQNTPPSDPIWGQRPDPARLTLQEIVGHLADWNGVFLDRITRIRDEAEPMLQARTPEDMAQESGSFQAAPSASLTRFRSGRAEMVPILRALEPEQWERIGTISGHPVARGTISIEAWIVQICGHDGYHLQQVAQWVKYNSEKD